MPCARHWLFDSIERLAPGQLTQPIESSFPSIRETLAHLCGAEWGWIARWDGDSPTALPDGRELIDLPTIRAEWLAQERRLRAVLDRLGDHGVDQPLEYRGFDGRQYRQLFSEMIQHVVNHGSYHRGQVTMMLRQLGAAPAKQMDLVAFHRERNARAS